MEKLPECIKPGGRAAILTFHSGEDRLVKKALKSGYKAGIYSDYAKDVIRPSAKECAQNGRARSTRCGGRLRSNRKKRQRKEALWHLHLFRINCDSGVFSREPNIEPHWCSDAFLIFIVLGMFFGSDGVIRISFENFELAEQICSIALIFIMFYGGFGQNGALQNQLLCARLFYRLPVLFLRQGWRHCFVTMHFTSDCLRVFWLARW